MRQRSVLAAVCAALFLTSPLPRLAAEQRPWNKEGAVDAAARQILKDWNVPGAGIAVIVDGEIRYLKGVGARDAATGAPVTADTVFALASVTKTFTATSVAMLVDDGVMAWDDRVSRHLPEFHLADSLADANVTLRDLLSHRTGLDGHGMLWYGRTVTQPELIRAIAYLQPSHGFRTNYHYQNLMFMTAAYVVGQAGYGSWDRFLQRRIFGPLEMTDATARAADLTRRADVATPHQEGKPMPRRVIDVIGGAGAINASTRDMATWTLLHLGRGMFKGTRLVSERSLGETHMPHVVIPMSDVTRRRNPFTVQQSYGLGWFIEDYRTLRRVYHTGNIDGFSNRFDLLPDRNIGVVVLTNADGSGSRDALANAILDIVLGAPPFDWNAHMLTIRTQFRAGLTQAAHARANGRKPNTQPSHPLADYAGDYQHLAYGRVRITLDADRLRLSWDRFTLPLSHFHYDTFEVRDAPALDAPYLEDGEQIFFSLAPDGGVASLTLRDVTFTRAARTPRGGHP